MKTQYGIPLPEAEKFIEKHSFQVPYDGSDNFYNEEKAKSAEKAIEFADETYSPLLNQLKEALENNNSVLQMIIDRVDLSKYAEPILNDGVDALMKSNTAALSELTKYEK